MKICFSTLGCYDYSFEKILDVAEKYGSPVLEVRGVNSEIDHFKIPEFAPESTESTMKILADRGISLYGLGTTCSFHSAEKLESMIEDAKKSILLAKRLGFSYIRVFGNKLTEDREECFRRVGDALCFVSDFAKEQGIKVLLEIHGDYTSPETVKPLLDIVGGNEAFGIIWDIANTKDVAGEGWRSLYELIRPYMLHVHVKDITAEGGVAFPGEGIVPLVPIIRAIVADGYDGYFSFEWEKKWHPEIGDMEPAFEKMIEILTKA